jgi:hypothetical protein
MIVAFDLFAFASDDFQDTDGQASILLYEVATPWFKLQLRLEAFWPADCLEPLAIRLTSIPKVPALNREARHTTITHGTWLNPLDFHIF